MSVFKKPFVAYLIAFVLVAMSTAYLIVLAPQVESQSAVNEERPLVAQHEVEEEEEEEENTPPTENDNANESQETTQDGARQPHILLEYGYGVARSFDNFAVYVGFLLYNPNDDIAISFPGVRVTARAADNSILSTQNEVLGTIYPGQTMARGNMSFMVNEEPASVEFEVIPPDDWNWTIPQTLDVPTYVPLDVTNISQREDGFFVSFTGEVFNHSDYDIADADVTIIFRDENGEIAGGDWTMIHGLNANSSVPFEINIFEEELITEDFEIYAVSRIW